MKKFLFIGLMLLMAVPAYAGLKSNAYQRWLSVTTETTITLPYTSRDVFIQNGSSIDICVNIIGGTTGDGATACDEPGAFQLDGASSLQIRDFRTDAISLKSTAAVASPITVLVTY